MKLQFLIFVFAFFFLSTAMFSEESFGKVIPVKGIPLIKGSPDIQVTSPMPLNQNDTIFTGKDTFATVMYHDGTELKLMPETLLSFHKNFIRMKQGNTLFHFAKKGTKFKVYVPTALVGVFGTTFSINLVNTDTAEIALFKGSIDAVALGGNKKRITLPEGHMVVINREGILDNPKPLNPSASDAWNSFGAVKNPAPDTLPAPELTTLSADTNLDTFGNISYSILPWAGKGIDNSYQVKINGFITLNGKQLLGERTQALRMDKLESNTYEFAVLLNGIEHTFTVDIDDSKNGFCQRLPYITNDIELDIKGIPEVSIMKELDSGKVSAILHHNGAKIPLRIFHDGNNQIPEGCNNILWSRCVLFFSYPEETEQLPLLEFNYTGELDLKERQIKLQLVPEKNKYKIQFK